MNFEVNNSNNNWLLKEYRKLVQADKLDKLDQNSVSELLNAFGMSSIMMNEMFKDICLVVGGLLATKSEL